MVRHVMVAGDWVIRDYRHAHHEDIERAYVTALARLQAR